MYVAAMCLQGRQGSSRCLVGQDHRESRQADHRKSRQAEKAGLGPTVRRIAERNASMVLYLLMSGLDTLVVKEARVREG